MQYSRQNRFVKFEDLGFTDYQSSWDYQESLMKGIIDIKIKNRINSPENFLETPNYLIFLEHPHVYTLGKNGNGSNMLINSEKLKSIDADFIRTNRGGDITYHGLGQIVGYPVLDLENFYTDIHRYMRDLEEVVIRTLSEYGLKGERSKGETGVWIDFGKTKARKICALGVRASRWVTMHGFSLNVNTDLSYFENIIPCGIADKNVTSLKKELGKSLELGEVKERLKKHFLQVFNCQFSC